MESLISQFEFCKSQTTSKFSGNQLCQYVRESVRIPQTQFFRYIVDSISARMFLNSYCKKDLYGELIEHGKVLAIYISFWRNSSQHNKTLNCIRDLFIKFGLAANAFAKEYVRSKNDKTSQNSICHTRTHTRTHTIARTRQPLALSNVNMDEEV